MYNYNLYAVNLLFHHFCHIPGINNNKCSSRLVQCLRILDVNRKVEEGGRGQQEGGRGREADRGRVWSGGEHGVREGGSVGGWDGGREITAGQGGMKMK